MPAPSHVRCTGDRMRDAILYLTFLVVSLAVLTAAQFGWRPPFSAVWDGPSKLALTAGGLVLVCGAAFGLGALIPVDGLPERFRRIPAVMTWTCCLGLVGGIQSLSTKAPAADIAIHMAGALSLGALAGVLLGLLPKDPDQPAQPEHPDKLHARLSIALGVIAMAVAGLLAVPRPADKLKFTSIETYNNGGACLQLEVSSGILGKAGVIRLARGDQNNMAVFDHGDYFQVSDLISKAMAAQSGQWRRIGSYFDQVPGDGTSLEVSAGQGVRFEASSRYGDRVVFELPPAEFERFRAAIARVETALH